MGANLRSRIDEEQAADDRGHTFVDDEVRYFVNTDQAAAKGTGIKGYAGGTGKGPESSMRYSMKMMAFPLNFLLREMCTSKRTAVFSLFRSSMTAVHDCMCASAAAVKESTRDTSLLFEICCTSNLAVVFGVSVSILVVHT